jgi:hypothetical protein
MDKMKNGACRSDDEHQECASLKEVSDESVAKVQPLVVVALSLNPIFQILFNV